MGLAALQQQVRDPRHRDERVVQQLLRQLCAGFVENLLEGHAGGLQAPAQRALVQSEMARHPQLRVIALSAFVYKRFVLDMLNAGAVGWTDWNILLDERGGPNHVGNFCFAPIHENNGELIYTPSYYYLGHFSKFIRPDAKRVSAVSSRSVLQTTSFMNADNKLATVVMNNTDAAINYRFYVGNEETTVNIPAHAMQTLVY